MSDYIVRGIAWDDEESKMMRLADVLSKSGDVAIELLVKNDEDSFFDAAIREKAQFAVLDIVDEGKEAGSSGVAVDLDEDKTLKGFQLANRLRTMPKWSNRPIFLYTKQTATAVDYQKRIGTNYPIFSKMEPLPYVAYGIIQVLRDQGLCPDFSRAFVIHNAERGDLVSELQDILQRAGKVTETVNPSNALDHLAIEVTNRIKNCGYVIAICSADHRIRGGGIFCKQNVILELGAALGIFGSARRVILLKQNAPENKRAVQLPSDLSGLLYLEFNERIAEIEDKLVARLNEVIIRMGQN